MDTLAFKEKLLDIIELGEPHPETDTPIFMFKDYQKLGERLKTQMTDGLKELLNVVDVEWTEFPVNTVKERVYVSESQILTFDTASDSFVRQRVREQGEKLYLYSIGRTPALYSTSDQNYVKLLGGALEIQSSPALFDVGSFIPYHHIKMKICSESRPDMVELTKKSFLDCMEILYDDAKAFMPSPEYGIIIRGFFVKQ